MREEWKDITGYEGLYQVSNTGRVKSLERTVWTGRGYYKTLPERILKACKSGNGYLLVALCKDGKDKRHYVHRLVATAFLENPMGYKEINHIDENKQNNCMENLEYCSRLYNANYGTRNQRAGEKLKGRKFSEETIKKIAESKKKPVYSIDKESGLFTYWESAKEAGEVLGIDPSSIARCCKGKLKSAGGFYWFYADSEEVM